jgi:hypothetical protein
VARPSILAPALTLGALLIAAAPAQAAPRLSLGGLVDRVAAGATDTSCQDGPSSKPFARWADRADYVPAPSGDFERGLADWDGLGSVRVTRDNEPWRVSGSDDDGQAVTIGAGSSLVSPDFCGGIDHPTVRFFARADRSRLAIAAVTIRYTGRDHLLHALPLGLVSVGADWTPTSATATLSGIPVLTGTKLGLTITPLLGSLTVDDVYVDPYRRS